MNPSSCDQQNNHFVCLQKKKLKYNIKTKQFVGHSQLRSLDMYDFSKMTPVVDEIQASLNGNTIKQSSFE